MPLNPNEAQSRVTKALDALDSIFTLVRGTISHLRTQHKLLGKAKKDFEVALDGLFTPQDVLGSQEAPNSINVPQDEESEYNGSPCANCSSLWEVHPKPDCPGYSPSNH